MADAVCRHGHQYPAPWTSSRTVAHVERAPHTHRAGLATCRILPMWRCLCRPGLYTSWAASWDVPGCIYKGCDVLNPMLCGATAEKIENVVRVQGGRKSIARSWKPAGEELIDATIFYPRTAHACAVIMHREGRAEPCGDTHVRSRREGRLVENQSRRHHRTRNQTRRCARNHITRQPPNPSSISTSPIALTLLHNFIHTTFF